jgi:hypothetical protein
MDNWLALGMHHSYLHVSCSFCSLCDYRRVVTVRGRENILNLVLTLSLAYLEHINILCTWCSITDYPRVVTSTREGKGWTRCTFTFDRLDRVVPARWLHLQVILDPLDKHSTFDRFVQFAHIRFNANCSVFAEIDS